MAHQRWAGHCSALVLPDLAALGRQNSKVELSQAFAGWEKKAIYTQREVCSHRTITSLKYWLAKSFSGQEGLKSPTKAGLAWGMQKLQSFLNKSYRRISRAKPQTQPDSQSLVCCGMNLISITKSPYSRKWQLQKLIYPSCSASSYSLAEQIICWQTDSLRLSSHLISLCANWCKLGTKVVNCHVANKTFATLIEIFHISTYFYLYFS